MASPAERMFEKVAKVGINLKDLDDKARISEHIHNMSSDSSMIRETAVEYTGMIAAKYGGEFVILCGALPDLKKCLTDVNHRVATKAALAVAKIAHSGSAQELLNNGFGELLLEIVRSDMHTRTERDACARALGYLYACVD